VLGGGALPPGNYALGMTVVAQTGPGASISISGANIESTRVDVAAGAPAALRVRAHHRGGRFELEAALSGSAPASIWVSDATLTGVR
jgi:hypothetical protein